ncbi:hypothetical protein V9T40_009786 [Parthenolecanium corni]|uniref:Uncharacterized protein n=1 Tax=Parthenolecanium corni TaxID=536013 RepID=A0AAN9TKG3_9HEMI
MCHTRRTRQTRRRRSVDERIRRPPDAFNRTDVDSCDTRSATGRRSVERRAADNAPSSPPPTKGDDRRARDSEESTRPPGRVTFFTSVRVCVHTRTSALPGSDVDFRETVRSSDLVRVAG